MSKIDRAKYNYETTKVRDKDGKVRHSAGNGDAIASAMLGMTHDDMVATVKANGLNDKMAKHITGAVNTGMFRMALGNVLRGLVRKGTPVTIGAHTVKKLDQKIDTRDIVVKDEPKAKAAAKVDKLAKTTAKAETAKPAPSGKRRRSGATATAD